MSGYDPSFLSWIAGFFDGEGSVCLSVAVTTRKNQRTSFIISPTVTITQGEANSHILQMIRDTLGFGRIYRAKNAKWARGHWQPTTRSDARLFLTLILPHLRVKRRQAEAMLSALDLLEDESKTRAGERYRRGGHVLSRDAARKLTSVAVSLNPKRDGSRYSRGRTEEEMNAALDRVYGPETPVQ